MSFNCFLVFSLPCLCVTGMAANPYTDCYLIEDHKLCLPQINVAGFHKAGSSALYFLLQSHQDVISMPKEVCPYQKDLKDPYFNFLNRTKDKQNIKFFISACMLTFILPTMINDLKPKFQKQLFVVQNLADLMWSGYNFFCSPNLDSSCPGTGYWMSTMSAKPYKTPELFHELVSASINSSIDIQSLQFVNYVHPANSFSFKSIIQKYISLVGKERILVLKGEEINSCSREISAFTGLKIIHEKIKKKSSFLINANGHPGANNVTFKSATYQKGFYAVSNFRPMLNKTRILIDEVFKPTCIWLRENFNIHYTNVC